MIQLLPSVAVFQRGYKGLKNNLCRNHLVGKLWRFALGVKYVSFNKELRTRREEGYWQHMYLSLDFFFFFPYQLNSKWKTKTMNFRLSRSPKISDLLRSESKYLFIIIYIIINKQKYIYIYIYIVNAPLRNKLISYYWGI